MLIVLMPFVFILHVIVLLVRQANLTLLRSPYDHFKAEVPYLEVGLLKRYHHLNDKAHFGKLQKGLYITQLYITLNFSDTNSGGMAYF
jgi:hypothetical protein